MTQAKVGNGDDAVPALADERAAEHVWKNTTGLRKQAKWALQWERLWPELWSLIGIIAGFLSLAMIGVFDYLSRPLHGLLLLGFAALLARALWRLKRCDLDIQDHLVLRRIERDNGLEHRPFDSILDQPFAVAGDKNQWILWQEHLNRAAHLLFKLKPSWPKPGLAAKDIYALRAALTLFFVIALTIGGGDAWPRILNSFWPGIATGKTVNTDIRLWITPPPYTARAPIVLSTKRSEEIKINNPEQIINIPVGSQLLVEGDGDQRSNWLKIGVRKLDFLPVARNKSDVDINPSYQIKSEILITDVMAKQLIVSDANGGLTTWPVRIVADVRPTIEWDTIQTNNRPSVLSFSYMASDDYGIDKVQLLIEHGKAYRRQNGEQFDVIQLGGAGQGKKSIKNKVAKDLSSHPWAGDQVVLRLKAIDEKQQTALSKPLEMVLPARKFNHPVAQQLVRVRKMLNNPSPGVQLDAARALAIINQDPTAFYGDLGVYLSISIVRGRLIRETSDDVRFSMQTLLWQLALKIEEGDFAVAEKKLNDMRAEIIRAIENGDDQKKIDRLLSEMQQALTRYLSSLADFMNRQGVENMPYNAGARVVDGQDLERLINKAREFSKTGDQQSARQLLTQMGRMMDQIRGAMETGSQARSMKEAGKSLQELRSLMGRQTDLLENTFQLMQRLNQNLNSMKPGQIEQQLLLPPKNNPESATEQENKVTGDPNAAVPKKSKSPGVNGQALKSKQQQLRKDLGTLMLKMDQLLGAIPPVLGRAERAMNNAEKSLSNNKPGQAVGSETSAVENLRQAMENISEQISRRFGGMSGQGPGFGQGPNARGFNPGRDPFGRRGGGGFGGIQGAGSFPLPDQTGFKKSRKIMQELRRRGEDASRPQQELDYIERLLDRF